VVNDGSGEEFLHVFDDAEKLSGCTVLRHDVNKGKGEAIKTAMSYFLDNRPDGLGVVTVDDDGQHLPDDVLLCAETMAGNGAFVLGKRDFGNPEVPLKSRMGNRLTAKLFSIWIGLDISDSQTGLRAIPRKYISAAINVPGSRFEYETNVLIAAKKGRFDIMEVPISTVYIDKNKNTRFRTLRDSLEVMLQFVKYAQISLVSCAIDLLSFYAFLFLLGWRPLPGSWNLIFISTVMARVLSSAFNFIFNKNFVFRFKGERVAGAALKYYALCFASMALSGCFVSLCAYLLLADTARSVTITKIAVDSALFFINYYIQRKWVFK
jgi:putative flippase GtrA